MLYCSCLLSPLILYLEWSAESEKGGHKRSEQADQAPQGQFWFSAQWEGQEVSQEETEEKQRKERRRKEKRLTDSHGVRPCSFGLWGGLLAVCRTVVPRARGWRGSFHQSAAYHRVRHLYPLMINWLLLLSTCDLTCTSENAVFNLISRPFISGKLGSVWRQLQSVVPPGLCGTVGWACREGGLHLHKLHTARLQPRRIETKKSRWRMSRFNCKLQQVHTWTLCGTHTAAPPLYLLACPQWTWCYFLFFSPSPQSY